MDNKNIPLSDNLISPNKSVKKEAVKVVGKRDGLMERTNQKVVTVDGRQILKEEGQQEIL